MPGSSFNWSAVAVLISISLVPAEGFADELVLFDDEVLADDIAPLPLPAGAIVALPFAFELGADAVLFVPLCVLLLVLEEDEDDCLVEVDELEVPCA
jgi:hypothetical protein